MAYKWDINAGPGVLDLALSNIESQILNENYCVQNIRWDSCVEPSSLPKKVTLPSTVDPDSVKEWLQETYQCLPLQFDLVNNERPMYYFTIHSNDGTADIAMGHDLQALIDLACAMLSVFQNNNDILPTDMYSSNTILKEFAITRYMYMPDCDDVFTKKVWYVRL